MHALRSATRISNRLTHWVLCSSFGIGFQELELSGVELALQLVTGLGFHGMRCQPAQIFLRLAMTPAAIFGRIRLLD
jgi:hypothetical protein